MANLRILKKEIDYRLEEFVFDCEMAAFVQPNKEDAIVELMQKSVELRNALYCKANNPAEPKNRSLVKKHYSALRRDMVSSFASMFADLSAICNQ
ncbi:MAG: hypothetical protein IKW52_04360 [Alistipes sp.]|nr:hypothetical protein [Alistipes sp.]